MAGISQKQSMMRTDRTSGVDNCARNTTWTQIQVNPTDDTRVVGIDRNKLTITAVHRWWWVTPCGLFFTHVTALHSTAGQMSTQCIHHFTPVVEVATWFSRAEEYRTRSNHSSPRNERCKAQQNETKQKQERVESAKNVERGRAREH